MNLRLILAGIMLLLTVSLSGCAYYGSYRYGYSDRGDYYYRRYPYRGYRSYDYYGRHGHPYHGDPFGYHRDRDGK